MRVLTSRARRHVAILATGLVPAVLPVTAAPPGEVTGVEWCAGSTACLSWDTAAGATSYTVYRGNGEDLPALENVSVNSAFAGVFSATTTGEMLIGELRPRLRLPERRALPRAFPL